MLGRVGKEHSNAEEEKVKEESLWRAQREDERFKNNGS